MRMSLKQQLASWDGKSKEQALAIYHQFSDQADFIDQLCKSLKFVSLQKSASWLIKYYLEQRFKRYKKQHQFQSVSAAQLQQDYQQQAITLTNTILIYRHLIDIAHWQTKLHFLQSFVYLTMPRESVGQIEHFLRVALIDENKFVRAWAYNGFHLLALSHPQYRQETDQLLKMGMRDEPASVQARIRKIVDTER